MAEVRDTATFTIKSLGLYRIEPDTGTDWRFLNKIIAEKLESGEK